MRLAAILILLVVLAAPAVAAEADTDTERDTWRSDIEAARVRAEGERAALKAEFERRRIDRLLHPQSSEDWDREQAQRLSDAVKNDDSLQRGDIVSTVDGLYMYLGNSQGERKPDDFVRLPAPSRR